MIKNCVYFCEGPCDVALINALRKEPSLIVSGRPREFNVIQNQITNSMLLTIKPGTTVVFVFDTDKEITDKLKRSIELIKTRCPKTKIVFLMQVKNLEDELVRCTDLRKVTDLTQSESLSNFKTAFCRITNLRYLLERHKIDVNRLWTTNPPEIFAFVPCNSELIKIVPIKTKKRRISAMKTRFISIVLMITLVTALFTACGSRMEYHNIAAQNNVYSMGTQSVVIKSSSPNSDEPTARFKQSILNAKA